MSKVRCVTLAGEVDLAGFRAAARQLLQQGNHPEAVQWLVAGAAAPDLFDAEGAASATPAAGLPVVDLAPEAAAPRVPADFLALCGDVIQHADPGRFHRLYRLLWRLQGEPALRHDALDPELAQARLMAQAVRREQHKMKAFVRFREVRNLHPADPADPADAAAGAAPLHVAWFEPAHHVVEAVAPFFMRRFAGMRFAILTPERSVQWDGQALTLGPGAGRHQAPPADAGEALWLTYYASIFNPARLKLKAMEKEMPRRYWANLPEAGLISGLAARAQARSGGMVESEGTQPRRRLPPGPNRVALADPVVNAGASAPDTLEGLRSAAAACRACPLGALATQTVFGEGPPGAALMLVGEQPGDHEDLQGQPFVGPAGHLLARAMAQLGWPRSAVYITNAVKHFKYEPRGRRRIHKTPAQQEADACLHWLDREIALVAPQAIIALGATAARQLLGRPVPVLRERGQWLMRHDGLPLLVTLHPAALLRLEPDERDAAYAAWLADLACASGHVHPATPQPSLPTASGTPAPRARAARGI